MIFLNLKIHHVEDYLNSHRFTFPEIWLDKLFIEFLPILSINEISNSLTYVIQICLLINCNYCSLRIYRSFTFMVVLIQLSMSQNLYFQMQISKYHFIVFDINIFYWSIETKCSICFTPFRFILESILPEIGFLFISKKWINKFDSSKLRSMSFSFCKTIN